MISIMPELRLNLVTREWVIISTEKAKRPEEFKQRRNKRVLPEFLDSCPFCPGNEHKTPDEVMRIPNDGGWLVRVIPNKYAVLSSKGDRIKSSEGLKHFIMGVGAHEIIIESPKHNEVTALFQIEDIANIIKAYRSRFVTIYKNSVVRHIIIFKNQGEGSGTSLEHPHSQLIAIPITPFQVSERIMEARRFFDNTGDCIMCAVLKDELADGRRIIKETNYFVTFIPYAALSPFHTWIIPKRHSASFGDIKDDEVQELAGHLKVVLSKLYYGLNNPDFNYAIRSESMNESGSESFHWYLSIVPRLAQASGFELGSGMYTNTSIPEEIAEFMRKVNPIC